MMTELWNAVQSADDEYLIGLTNKGTVKRAYKDMETAEISAEYGESEITVNTGGEKCTIKSPLAESKCSCPSRSICRHIITAILWLKGNTPSLAENSQTAESERPDKALQDELSSYPLKVLEKAMKKAYYTAVVGKAEKHILPEIEESSVVTVKFPDENISVKLISPLEYSSCSCHSKELCRHKAAAIFAWQVKHKIIEPKLSDIKSDTAVIDMEKVQDTAEYAVKFLSGILSDGLVRLSEDTAEHAEIVAVMCHNARLADSERQIREIGGRLKKYIAHSPEFHAQKLYSLVMESLVLLQKIIHADTAEKITRCSGEFKAVYVPMEKMELIPIASRYFSSLDYEGNIYYFVNKNTQSEYPFLTYSDIRPTFYEGNRRNQKYHSGVWGITGNMQDIMKSEIRLENPKVADGKLSSSSDTKAILLGKKDMNHSAVYGKVYTNYAKMVREIFSKPSGSEIDRLVLTASEKCISSSFDEITQSQKIVIGDKYGHYLTLKARYRNESKDMIERMDKIGKIMMNNPGIHYVIFGSTYIENGRCYIYPIAVYDDIYVSKMVQTADESAEGTADYSYFSRLFEEIQNMLCDMIQCGINSFDLYAQITDNAEESRKMGLLALGNMLEELSGLLKAKNHTYSNDNSHITALLTKIYAYLTAGISKTEVQIAVSNLTEEIDE